MVYITAKKSAIQKNNDTVIGAVFSHFLQVIRRGCLYLAFGENLFFKNFMYIISDVLVTDYVYNHIFADNYVRGFVALFGTCQ